VKARAVFDVFEGSHPGTDSPDQVSRQSWLSLALVSTATFIIILDLMATNVAFPFIELEFSDTPRSTLAWVSSGNGIAAAALLLVAGRLGDRYGRRRVFLIGLAIFTAVSAITAAAPNPTILIAARVGQGAGAAMVTSTAIALLMPLFPPNKRGLAVGIWGTCASAGAAAGPTLGAIAIEAVDWRWAFLINVPIGLIVLALGRRVLAETERAPGSGPIDYLGTVVGTAAIGLLTFGVLQGPRWGWTSGTVSLALVVSVVLAVAFVVRCDRAASPLIDLSLFRDRRFALANLSQVGTQLAINAWFFTTPLFLINVWGFSALAGGTAVAVGMVVSFVSVPVGHWSDRHGYRGVLALGGVIAALGMLVWVFGVDESPDFWSFYLVGLLLFGLGAGMVGIVVTNAALTDLPEHDLGIGNAVFQTVRRLSGAIGVAIAVALIGDRSNESVEAFRGVWVLIAGGYLFSTLAILRYPTSNRQDSVKAIRGRG
jgi:EmrB/QacA subfamily drug resistance transporter